MNFFASRLNRMGSAAVGAAMLIGSLAPLNAQVPIGGRIPDFVPPELPPITPCEIVGDVKEVPLPAGFDSLDVGGGGRYIVFHISELRKLAVFDVSQAKVVKFIPAAADDILFAAGGDSLVVLLKAQKIVQRWSLKTFEREFTQTISGPSDPHAMAFGSASSGPVLITGKDQYDDPHVYLDPKTFKEVNYTRDKRSSRGMPERGQIRVSADGKMFGGWRIGTSPSGLFGIKVGNGKEEAKYEHDSVGYVVPSADGRHLFTARGIFTSELKPIGGSGNRGHSYTSFPIPSVHGNYYITIPNTDSSSSRDGKVGSMGLHIFGDARPLVSIPRIMAKSDRSAQWSRESLSLDKRFIFVPDAKVLVTYNQERNKLILHSLDLEKELEKSATDYLFVSSRPPSRADVGRQWVYKPAVRSKKGAVVMNLESGPEGMKLTGDTLTWQVPATAAGTQHSIILSIKDGSGQELLHNFNVGIGGEPVGPVAVLPARPTKPMQTGPAPPILAPNLDGRDRVEYKLPGTVSDIAVGGAGRFLCMHIPSLRKVGIFDANVGKIVEYVSASGEDIHIAAGRNKLIVLDGASRIASRYDLLTREREVTSPVEIDGPVYFAVMGSAVNGPLVIGTPKSTYGTELSFFHIGTMRKVEVKTDGRSRDIAQNFRASANGKVYGSWATGSSPSGIRILVMDGTNYTLHYEHESAGHLIPSETGQVIYSGSGIWNKEAKRLGSDKSRRGWFVPSVHEGYYLSMVTDIRSMREPKPIDMGLHIQGSEKPLLMINGIPPMFEGIFNRDRKSLPFDKRIFFIPKANLLATVGITQDVLHLRKLDIDKALDASGIDYLFVNSQPPMEAKVGDALKYPIKVKSKRGGVKFGYESGPEGMAMSPAGEITWNVPASAAGKTHSVIVLVGDDSGQELYHTFRIAVDGPDNVVAQPDNPRPIPGVRPPVPVRPPVGAAQKFMPGTYRIDGTVIIFRFDASGRFSSQSHGTGTWSDNGDGSILINRSIKFTYNPIDKTWRGIGALGGRQQEMKLQYLRP